jgi:hypothetical protein
MKEIIFSLLGIVAGLIIRFSYEYFKINKNEKR